MAKLQTRKAITAHLLTLPGADGSYPFGPGALVFKVANKMFALLAEDETPLTMNLKCDPDEALALRAAHKKSITPGYHMNKRHWNTIILDGSLSDGLVKEMIAQSYGLVVSSLPKATREKLAQAKAGGK
jgi:predicted DNA-binding protein (MmcQ/YjbR family)